MLPVPYSMSCDKMLAFLVLEIVLVLIAFSTKREPSWLSYMYGWRRALICHVLLYLINRRISTFSPLQWTLRSLQIELWQYLHVKLFFCVIQTSRRQHLRTHMNLHKNRNLDQVFLTSNHLLVYFRGTRHDAYKNNKQVISHIRYRNAIVKRNYMWITTEKVFGVDCSHVWRKPISQNNVFVNRRYYHRRTRKWI